MVVKDKEKNREYVAKHRAMKKANEESKKEYNNLNYSYLDKHRKKLKEEIGVEEYNKTNAEYMRQYRAKLKQAKEQTKTTNAITLQSAIRNRLARNAILRKKQDKANELLSQMNQKKQEENNKQQLQNKLIASVNANDMLNDMFSKLLGSIPERQPRVKLVARILKPDQEPKRKPGRPRKQG